MMQLMKRMFVIAAFGGLAGGCIPYTVGTTAHPTEPGELVSSGTLYFIPNGVEAFADSADTEEGATYSGIDAEVRFGLDQVSDVGLRVPGFSGVVVNYKRRLNPNEDRDAPATAAMVGAGIVNAGQHAHLEFTLLTSGRQRETITPYGGIRGMQVIPISGSAVSDSPTLGIFGGARLGTPDLGVSPELGVYYDRSALNLRSSSFIVVPAVTVHGSRLRKLLPFF